jgi:hypothetical protein
VNNSHANDSKPLIMKTILFTLLILTIILIASTIIFAQPPGLPDGPAPAPIDGGLGLLAAAGGAYAYKKLRFDKTQE